MQELKIGRTLRSITATWEDVNRCLGMCVDLFGVETLKTQGIPLGYNCCISRAGPCSSPGQAAMRAVNRELDWQPATDCRCKDLVDQERGYFSENLENDNVLHSYF